MSSGQQRFSGNRNSFNVLTYHNHSNIVSFNTEAEDERNKILQWLSPLEPQQRHEGVRTDRLDSVGNWVLETNEFKKWSEMVDGCAEPVLFCYGGPGVGKTYLSSLVIDSLCDWAEGKDIAVVGLYCDFAAQQEQSTRSMLGAIIKQLINRGGMPEHIREAFQKAKREFGGRGLLLPNMVDILEKTVASLERVFICIDALDESAPKHQRELLLSLRKMISVSPNTRIFLTGRRHIEDEIIKYFSMAVRIPVSPTEGGIRDYLEMRLDRDTDPGAMNDELRADILQTIPENMSGSFLLVSLKIDAILGEVTLHQRRKKLDQTSTGEGLDLAYAATLSRVKEQQGGRSKLGMKVLMWVSHSERPLLVNELCHALGVEEGSIDLNIDNIPGIETLLACSLGLVTVEKSSSTVRLVHYTLQEYLSRNPHMFHKPHSTIAEVCLTYLNFRYVTDLSPTLRSVPTAVPFVEYASCYWGTHARWETTERVKILALELLNGYDQHISSKILLLRSMGFGVRPFDGRGSPKGFTGLHGAAFLGCVEITLALLEMNIWDVQATDSNGNTAISWAARRGYSGVVKVLLRRSDINPNTPDMLYGRTPLLWAAENGHEEVVRALLEQNDVNPNTPDTQYGRTPLSWAAGSGLKGVVKILLARDDVNHDTASTENGRTPLSWAAGNGHKGVVKMLLAVDDVDPNVPDTRYGRTPLLWAVVNWHEGVVRILLEQNKVNPNIVDTQSAQAPLSWAAENGHEEMARMLLDRIDINPNITDARDGRTPLSWAAESGHEEMAGMLLDQIDINPNIADARDGRTPLSWAAGNGHEGVVRMLLERKDVVPSTADTLFGQTLLSWAAENGREEVVRMLLDRIDINPNIADARDGRTPLAWAAGIMHEGIVRMLLERRDVNPNTADRKYDQIPLSLAARGGHEGVVRMLLDRIDIDPDIADARDGRTPLSWAAGNGHEGVVRMLLERKDVNPNIADTLFGETSLLWAAQNGHEGVVRMLLERVDANPNTADTLFGRTPLLWAAKNGHEGVVRMLLDQIDINPNIAGAGDGRMPLFWAAGNGHEGVVRMLLERKDVDPNTADTLFGRTPLLWAAQNGHEGVVGMLLERKDVNPNTTDRAGQTPLLWAAKNGHERVVRMLLERVDTNPNTADTLFGRTPLLWAAENGREEVVRMLRERTNVPRYAASLQLTELFSTESPQSSEPSSKRIRRY